MTKIIDPPPPKHINVSDCSQSNARNCAENKNRDNVHMQLLSWKQIYEISFQNYYFETIMHNDIKNMVNLYRSRVLECKNDKHNRKFHNDGQTLYLSHM